MRESGLTECEHAESEKDHCKRDEHRSYSPCDSIGSSLHAFEASKH